VVSIIIVTWNSEKYIKPCLLSIFKQKKFGFKDYEIIVIDNNSQDNTTSIIEREFTEILVIKNSENLGYAKANNQGFKTAKGEYILLLNPDTELQDNFFIPILEFMERDLLGGAVAPKIINPDLTVQQSIRSFPDYSILIWEITGLAKVFPQHKIFGRWRMEHFDYNKLSEIDQPMASCLLARKSAVDKIGYFDEKFPMFYNDVDFCFRLKNAGWKIYYFPNSSVLHDRGSSTKRVRAKMIFSMHKSLYHYFEKYYFRESFELKKLLLYPIFLFTALGRASWSSLRR
jgi:GT2 family glycosyltransferase